MPSDSLSLKSTLEEHQYEAVARYVASGISLIETAENFGIKPAQLRRLLRNPLFRTILADVQRTMTEALGREPTKARSVLESAAPSAAATIIEIMENSDDKTALAAAKDVLDRAGFKAPEVNIHGVGKLDLSDEQRQTLAETLAQLKGEEDEIVDTEVCEPEVLGNDSCFDTGDDQRYSGTAETDLRDAPTPAGGSDSRFMDTGGRASGQTANRSEQASVSGESDFGEYDERNEE